MKPLSTQPPKGTRDWFPEEFQIRKYIFDTWRKVCTQFGYEEYLTPLLEDANIYRAKSGEDLGGKELLTMRDLAGRELAIRPEMTPSVTRMVCRKYSELIKPVRYFSIANFYRNENPQRGRNREFWQLNFDVFGSDSINADIEVAQIALEIMLRFNPPKNSFTFYLNNRKLIDGILNEQAQIKKEARQEVVRILDKWEKLSQDEFAARLQNLGLKQEQIKTLTDLMESSNAQELLKRLPALESNSGLKEIQGVSNSLTDLGYGDWVKFQPSVIRGFDYYDGMVYEVFDNNPKNNRSMFGGGRYNGLASLFGQESFPAVGFAPGDETTKLFLESWGLLNQIKEKTKKQVYYLPLLEKNLQKEAAISAQKLRAQGKIVELGLEKQKLTKALNYANKKKIDSVIILGNQELEAKKFIEKDMKTGKQKEVMINQA